MTILICLLLTVPKALVKAREYAAVNAAAGWSQPINISNTTDSSDTPAIAIDNKGNIHVVWTERIGSAYNVFYNMWDGYSWSNDENLNLGSVTKGAIAVDSMNNLHLVYLDRTNFRPYYREKSALTNTWSIAQPIDPGPGSAGGLSIHLDADDTPFVVWDNTYNSQYTVRYSYLAFGGWANSILVELNAMYPDMAIDPSGNLHFVFRSTVDYRIYYRGWIGNQWSSTTQMLSFVATGAFVDVDDHGVVHVACVRQDQNETYYRRWDGSWTSPSLILEQRASDFTVDDNSSIHILFVSSYEINYTYSKDGGLNWISPLNISGTCLASNLKRDKELKA